MSKGSFLTYTVGGSHRTLLLALCCQHTGQNLRYLQASVRNGRFISIQHDSVCTEKSFLIPFLDTYINSPHKYHLLFLFGDTFILNICTDDCP